MTSLELLTIFIAVFTLFQNGTSFMHLKTCRLHPTSPLIPSKDLRLQSSTSKQGDNYSRLPVAKPLIATKESMGDDKTEQSSLDVKEFLSRFVSETNSTFVSIKENAKKGRGEKRGEIWTYLELTLLTFIILGKFPIQLVPLFSWTLNTVAYSSLISGLVIFSLAVSYLRPQNLNIFTVPVTEDNLQTAGPYEIVRHPIYSGLLLTCIGFAMLTDSMERSILTMLLFWVLDNKANNEEEFLMKSHGSKFNEFKEATPKKLIPFVH